MAHELLAKSDHQLGMCLRMLYAEGIRGPIPVYSAKKRERKDGVSRDCACGRCTV